MKRKDVQVRKLQAEVVRLSGELSTLESCQPMPEACAELLGYISTEAKNDPLVTAFCEGDDENPYVLPAQRQGPCVCNVM